MNGVMWTIPFIILGGVLQSAGAAMNGQLHKSLVNPWLASAVSFVVVTFFFIGAFLVIPHPLPTARDLKDMPWWAPIGGLVGAVQVYAGLTMVTKVDAGLFVAVTVSSALVASLVIDHFGLLRMAHHPIGIGRLAGAGLLIVGAALIAKT